MQALYPLKLLGVTKTPIWGGTRLLKDWNKTSEKETVGESWELTVRPQEMCRVTGGALNGKTLGELIDAYGRELTGAEWGAEDFPLLIKLIDAQDSLSVQVHPDDGYAARVENDRGKTEMWYIVEADEGAELICGFADGVSREDFAAAVANGKIGDALRHQSVKAGETYFIPAGLTHAIGKGILIAEIQQNCDLTYRVYDYDRRQPDGSLRELHVEKALDVSRPFTEDEIDAIRYARTGGKAEKEGVLADCAYFRVEKLTVEKGAEQTVGQKGYMRHLLCIAGEGELLCNAETYSVKKGESWLLPACLDGVTVKGDLTLILSNAN